MYISMSRKMWRRATEDTRLAEASHSAGGQQDIPEAFSAAGLIVPESIARVGCCRRGYQHPIPSRLYRVADVAQSPSGSGFLRSLVSLIHAPVALDSTRRSGREGEVGGCARTDADGLRLALLATAAHTRGRQLEVRARRGRGVGRRCGADSVGCVQCATVAAIVQRSSVVDAGADAAEVVCESRWTQGVMEDGEVEALGQLDE